MKRLAVVLAALILPVGISTKAEAHTIKSCPQYNYLFAKYNLPVGTFSRIAYRESHCRPRAYNGRHHDNSYGLLQINTRGYLWGGVKQLCGVSNRAQLWNPETNIRCASKMYKRYGLRPWRTR